MLDRPFSGRVLGVYRRTCNLIDPDGNLVTLALAQVGNGPFSILVEDEPALLAGFEVDQAVQIDHRVLAGQTCRITLDTAQIWNPVIAGSGRSLSLTAPLRSRLQPFRQWPEIDSTHPVIKHAASRLARAAAALTQAVAGDEDVTGAVAALAGLGWGLTPAGDDFLIGVMAALWVMGQTDLLATIARIARPKTNLISAAFLAAAAKGEFIEPWHRVAQALYAGREADLAQALAQLSEFGASSGRDALAGFAAILLEQG